LVQLLQSVAVQAVLTALIHRGVVRVVASGQELQTTEQALQLLGKVILVVLEQFRLRIPVEPEAVEERPRSAERAQVRLAAPVEREPMSAHLLVAPRYLKVPVGAAVAKLGQVEAEDLPSAETETQTAPPVDQPQQIPHQAEAEHPARLVDQVVQESFT
jgi:hypothetical protein